MNLVILRRESRFLSLEDPEEKVSASPTDYSEHRTHLGQQWHFTFRLISLEAVVKFIHALLSADRFTRRPKARLASLTVRDFNLRDIVVGRAEENVFGLHWLARFGITLDFPCNAEAWRLTT